MNNGRIEEKEMNLKGAFRANAFLYCPLELTGFLLSTWWHGPFFVPRFCRPKTPEGEDPLAFFLLKSSSCIILSKE